MILGRKLNLTTLPSMFTERKDSVLGFKYSFKNSLDGTNIAWMAFLGSI